MMTPSMSRISARLSAKLAFHPVQIISRAFDHRQRDGFRHFVGMELLKCPSKRIEMFPRGFDDQQPLRGILDGSLPTIEAAYARQYVYTRCQFLVHQAPGDFLGLLRAVTCAEHNNFVRHMRFSFSRITIRWYYLFSSCFSCDLRLPESVTRWWCCSPPATR